MAGVVVTQTSELSSFLKPLAKGKVRDLYNIDDNTILFIATDRISAFDVVLETGIPDKGAILTQFSAFWFNLIEKKFPKIKNHLKSLELPESVQKLSNGQGKKYERRSMVVNKYEVLKIESVVRGYITGSAWSEYKKTGTVNGLKVAEGLQESQKFAEALWTPTTKADLGEHDEPISAEQAAELIGKENADKVRDISLKLYSIAHEYALGKGIIIADTKFEFGLDRTTNEVVLIDEVLTPDSSRFWSEADYEVGRSQKSVDKQPLRDWLTEGGRKGKDGVFLPIHVVNNVRAGYLRAYEQLTGEKFHSNAIKVLLVGNGGREHALTWKLVQSPKISQVFVCPGNGGTCSEPKATNVSHIKPSDFQGLAAFAKENNVDILLPGPEQPLVDGIVDSFEILAPGIKAFGPTRQAAVMEGSKAFSKDFMQRHGIATAKYQSFTKAQYNDAVEYIKQGAGTPVVIKADGLAGGKGVLIPADSAEAIAGLDSIMLKQEFGKSGDEVVIEELLEGHEISILSFCDGKNIKSLPPAQDHKRIGDGDKGPNTGGMGTYASAPESIVSQKMLDEIHDKMLRPTMQGMHKEGFPFIGCLFSGYMITKDGPKLLEYNVRFGDPETQSLLALMESDLAEVIQACVSGSLDKIELKVKDKKAATVVMAAGGYPGTYKNGIPMIISSTLPENVVLFHAGTNMDDITGKVFTAGGRVIASTAVAGTLEEAISAAYKGVESVKFEGMQFRRDIGARALK